ncbi:root meristem growth factor 3-like isoform X2 [Populus alba x Populus x berolinensis]|nr:root meristem growth factor 3-like isoform X2 [Populus alba x Populus x berolinensis]
MLAALTAVYRCIAQQCTCPSKYIYCPPFTVLGAFHVNCLQITVDGDGMVTTSIKKIGGRKVVRAHNIKRPEIKGNVAHGGTSRISSANDQVAGKYGHEGEVMDIGNKRNGGRFPEGVKESGFVAFNADYHEPRHHPPKNN